MLLIAWLATNGRWPLPELFGQRLERRARWRQDGAAPVVGRTIVRPAFGIERVLRKRHRIGGQPDQQCGNNRPHD